MRLKIPKTEVITTEPTYHAQVWEYPPQGHFTAQGCSYNGVSYKLGIIVFYITVHIHLPFLLILTEYVIKDINNRHSPSSKMGRREERDDLCKNKLLLWTSQELTMAIQIQLSIHYTRLPPARQDGAVILPASQQMNHYLPAGISYQLADMYQLTGFKPTTFFNV